LIATNGYSNASLRDIARTAGISTGTLLHHFESKEQLLIATLIQVSEDFHQHAQETMVQASDPAERLRAIARAVLESPRHDDGWRVWMAFWHEAALNPRLAPVASTRNELWEALLASVIRDGISRGQLRSRDPAESASELAAVINGVAIQRVGEPARWSAPRAAEVVERLIADWTA
jgi:AcrR family transcriptional regulator